MVFKYTIQTALQELDFISNHEKSLYKILEIYLELFPVKNAYLLRYSPLGYLGEGIYFISGSKGVHISEIRDDIRTIPVIFSAINEKRAKYITGQEYLKQMSTKYSIPSDINSLLVVPIYSDSYVLGYICSSDFEENFTIDETLLSDFTYFGNLVGKLIFSTQNRKIEKILSNRELEVMRRISFGESTKEMARTMQISELTVNQYVKTALKKLGVKNRAHAVSELIRRKYLM